MAGTGADWFRQRLGAAQPPAQSLIASPPGTVPYGYRQGPAPGQAYYAPPVAPAPGQAYYPQPAVQGYQPQPNGGYTPQYQGAGITPQGYFPQGDEGLLQERPSSLLIAARSAQATGGSRKAQEHMQNCPDCGGVMLTVRRRWKGEDQEHSHCYNCGAQEGVRDGSVIAAARAGNGGGGRVAPSRQYDNATHPVTVDAAGVLGPKGTMVTYQPNVRGA